MFDEISTTPRLQHVLTDLQLKLMGSNKSWLTNQFKIDSGACGNLMAISTHVQLFGWKPCKSTVDLSVKLLDYNKDEIKQIGTC